MSAAGQEVFEEHRALLFSVAYRVLGSAADADDAVQDAWLRWSAADRSGVADAKAYLARTTANLALERLRSARSQREAYVGPWLPEPVPTGDDAPDPDTVSIALLVVLETLSPLERAVFVLREAFAFDYAEIALAVDRSEAAVRQAAHRARQHVQARRPRFTADRAVRRDVTERFLAAAGGGDLNPLMDLLSPDVALWTDGGGKVRQALKPIIGAERVAAWFAQMGRHPYEGVKPEQMGVSLVALNGSPALVFRAAGRVLSTVCLDIGPDGLITALHNLANPDKLAAVAEGTVRDL
ncbi:RNA polymerase sigma-70 factor [Actinocorallia aurea]